MEDDGNMESIYLQLTREFNQSRFCCILSSGQAVVLHRLAIMSKDGDWIIREEPSALEFVLEILEKHGAIYRFGAPLDIRWLAWGWSSHFEFMSGPLRVRNDFVSRPPRIGSRDLEQLWLEQAGSDLPFVDAPRLAELKKTNREKDYAVIGELARKMPRIEDRFLYSRSARDLVALRNQHPEFIPLLKDRRPLLNSLGEPVEKIEELLDAERRVLMHAYEKRLAAYSRLMVRWHERWPELARRISGLALREAHRMVVEDALVHLPQEVSS